ncbi:hypothetical protein Tco_1272506 [Tanacetum coccineum]
MSSAGKQQECKYTITSFDTAELQECDQKRTLFETMTKTKSFNKNTKHEAVYHALIESILKDEEAMDKGVDLGEDMGNTHEPHVVKADPKDWFKKPKMPRIMVKDIDRQLLERRLMRSLEKFIGGREYGEDVRPLQRTT